ncbi:MAG: universal stress protein [Bacteroidota bacterium]
MKSILVPTDFFACAHFALDAAAQLATRFDGTLHVLHQLELPNGWEEMTLPEQAQYPEALQQIKINKS